MFMVLIVSTSSRRHVASLTLASKFPPFITSLGKRPAGASCNKHHVQPSRGRRTRHCLCPGMNGEDCIMSKLEEAKKHMTRLPVTANYNNYTGKTSRTLSALCDLILLSASLSRKGVLTSGLNTPAACRVLLPSTSEFSDPACWIQAYLCLPHLPLRPNLLRVSGKCWHFAQTWWVVVSRITLSKRQRSQRVGWRESSWAWPNSHHSRERVLSSSIQQHLWQVHWIGLREIFNRKPELFYVIFPLFIWGFPVKMFP